MRRRPRFEFGATSFEATLPSPPWSPKDASIGGVRSSAAGTPAAYLVRRDALLELTLRFDEALWPDCLAMLHHGQSAQPLTFYPDAEQLDAFAVYLEEPAAGTSFAPTRNAFPRVMEMKVTLRGVGGIPPWIGFYADDD